VTGCVRASCAQIPLSDSQIYLRVHPSLRPLSCDLVDMM